MASVQRTTTNINATLLEISEKDAIELTEVYHLQERPYTKDELRTAEWLLLNNLNLKKSLILFHIKLMDYSYNYLLQHPERLNHTLEPYTEIFINMPEGQFEQQINLIPNPKLLKVMSNNVIPAIARAYLLDNYQSQILNPNDLTMDQVRAGVSMVRKLGLFQTTIAAYQKSNEKILLNTFFPRTCPAMEMFSDALIVFLPEIYNNLKAIN